MDNHRERDRCLKELGLTEPASDEDIKKAYKAAAIKYHPDKNLEKDTTTKFQQIHAAYKFLTEGNEYIRLARQDAEEFSILRFLFPWMFTGSFFNSNSQSPFKTSNGYYDDSSDEECFYYEPQTTYTRSGAYTAGAAYAGAGVYNGGGAYTTGSARGANARGGGYTARGANKTDSSYTSHGATTTTGASGTSEHFQRNTNFTHTSSQHGQFFQESHSKGKAAKKRNRDAKRAAKLAADRETPQPASKTTLNTDPQSRPARAKSPTPDISEKQKRHEEDKPQPRQERESSESPEKGQWTSNAEARKDRTEDHSNKKSKKQIEMQREKDLKEIQENLLRREKERKEKLEKKRAIQEEKERKLREAKEKEEQEKAEEERQREQERRKIQEKKEEERKQKKREADKMQKLKADFDSTKFIDENGDFKYTDPEMKNIIHRSDVNHLGNARQNTASQKFETINGLTTEHLMKLQEDQPRAHQENKLGSPNHARLGPVGSRPQNAQTGHPGQQRSHHTNHHQEFQPQHQHQQHQPPQQMYNHPPPPLRQPTMPYWSSTQPPPPLHSINTNVPRASGRFNQGFAPNKTYRPGTRVFTQQNVHGHV